MSATDFEYAIKKDVRNNPIVREVDEARQRQLRARGGHRRRCSSRCCCSRPGSTSSCVQHGYLMERLQQERAAEEEVNRHLKLEIETLRAPRRIEDMATREAAHGRSRRPATSSSSSEWRPRRPPPSPSSRLGSRSAPEEDRWRTNRLAEDSGSRGRAARRRAAGAPSRRPSPDWRETVRSRLMVAAVLCGAVDRAPSKPACCICRCSSTPRWWRARRGSGRTPSSRRRAAATSSIATATCSPIPSTPIRSSPTRPRSRMPDDVAASHLRRARSLRRGRAGGDRQEPAPQGTVRLGRAQGLARRGAARPRPRAQGHRLLQGEPPLLSEARARCRTCSGTSASTTPASAGSSRRSTSRSAAATGSVLHPARRPAPRLTSHVEREPTAGASLELTIDQYLQNIAERELLSGVEEYRRGRRIDRRHGSDHRRDPRARQRADVQPQRLRARTPRSPAATARSRISTSRDRRSRS